MRENGMADAANKEALHREAGNGNLLPHSDLSPGASIDVRHFGAIGNGTTDDTGAIRRALSVLPVGGTLFFPIGTYKVSGSLAVVQDFITITGQGPLSRIVYTYEQTEVDTHETAGLFAFRSGAQGVTVKNMKLQYTGTFFGNVGQSYKGKISALYFKRCSDILITHMEISGFNANAVFVEGEREAYASRFKVNQCYLHHNRVGGVLFGFVEYISITDCDLDYNGSVLDGGTGYGCAGSSGGVPKHIQIIGNRCSYNYRKGIDLHAGIEAIIEGNVCHGNRLYGIYTEGPRTGNVTIRGNLITGMRRDKIGIPEPYTWITGIDFGPYSESLVPEEYHNYLIEGNQITDFGIGEGSAYPIHGYLNFRKGTIQIKNNIIRAGRVTHLVSLSPLAPGSRDVKLDISGNQAFADEVTDYAFHLPHCKEVNMQGNQITANQTEKRDGMIMLGNENLRTFTYIGNHMEASQIAAASALCGEGGLPAKTFKLGNFLNGVLE